MSGTDFSDLTLIKDFTCVNIVTGVTRIHNKARKKMKTEIVLLRRLIAKTKIYSNMFF